MRAVEAGPRSSTALNQIIGNFVCNELWGGQRRIEDYCSVGILDGDTLVAGVLYHNHYPEHGVIELTTASISRSWLNRPVLEAIFSLPFDRLNCQLVVIRVSERNPTMVRIAKAIGFQDHLIPRLRGRDEDEHILTLTDDDWRASRFHQR